MVVPAEQALGQVYGQLGSGLLHLLGQQSLTIAATADELSADHTTRQRVLFASVGH